MPVGYSNAIGFSYEKLILIWGCPSYVFFLFIGRFCCSLSVWNLGVKNSIFNETLTIRKKKEFLSSHQFLADCNRLTKRESAEYQRGKEICQSPTYKITIPRKYLECAFSVFMHSNYCSSSLFTYVLHVNRI